MNNKVPYRVYQRGLAFSCRSSSPFFPFGMDEYGTMRVAILRLAPTFSLSQRMISIISVIIGSMTGTSSLSFHTGFRDFSTKKDDIVHHILINMGFLLTRPKRIRVARRNHLRNK